MCVLGGTGHVHIGGEAYVCWSALQVLIGQGEVG